MNSGFAIRPDGQCDGIVHLPQNLTSTVCGLNIFQDGKDPIIPLTCQTCITKMREITNNLVLKLKWKHKTGKYVPIIIL